MYIPSISRYINLNQKLFKVFIMLQLFCGYNMVHVAFPEYVCNVQDVT